MPMIQKIIAALDMPGKSGKGLAEAMHINPSQVSRLLKGDRRIKAEEIPLIEQYLGISLLGGTPSFRPEVAPATVPFPDRTSMPLDVPVLGTAEGGNGDDRFQMVGEVIDYVRRPPGIAKAKHVFALNVRGTSMEPRYEEGDLIFLNPTLPARPGDDIVIEFTATAQEEYSEGCLKRLVRKTPTKLIVKQFNPPAGQSAELEFDLDIVKAIHRVLTLSELMGV